MPIDAATSGTLSMTDESRPMMPVMVKTSWMFLSRNWATSVRMPALCSADTDIRMPRKKRMVGMSMCLSTFDTRFLMDSSMPRFLS